MGALFCCTTMSETEYFPQDRIIALITSEFTTFLGEYDADMAKERLPPISKTRDTSNGDYTVLLKGACAKRKIDVEKYTQDLVVALNKHFEGKPEGFLQRGEALRGYINLYVNRPRVFSYSTETVLSLGDKFGTSRAMEGKKVIIEHTSSNPNGPLHIGNLRNVMLGAHLAKLLEAVGYDVKQHFFVNDLGAQIGLTALGYHAIYAKVQPKLKIDQWIGMIYACMNTLSELQLLGHTMQEMLDVYAAKETLEQSALHGEREGEDAKHCASRRDYLATFDSLYERQPELCVILLKECLAFPSIKKSAGELNLRYERNEPEAVKIFRAMVINCLSGVQQTLDTYNVRHDVFDFESELGWEGSNDRVMERLKASPYFVAETQQNEKGVPEGGHVLMSKFIRDAKLPTGKKGYQKDFPNFYVLRPDGSTLYTFRDVVYSLKKCSKADVVFNIIASEQNLPQEKVALTMALLDPKAPRKLYHMSYELVKLAKGSSALKMSGRRGRYVLADDLYFELRDAVIGFMQKKFDKQAEVNPELAAEFTDELLQEISGEVATASMKYALLSTPCRHSIRFDVQKVADPDEVSGPFLLYNAVRFKSLLRKYDEGVIKGEYPALPPLSEVDFSLLQEQSEWNLLLEYILPFPNTIQQIACPGFPTPPQLPEFATNKLCDFCMNLVNTFSSYYKSVRILTNDPAQQPAMFARIYFCKALQHVLDNALDILTMKPPQRM